MTAATRVLDFMVLPDPTPQLAAAGVGALVYIAPAAWNWSKAATAPELRAFETAGVEYALNFETSEGQMNDGFSAGLSHGHAVQTALGELAVDGNRPVYFSCDEPVQANNMAFVANYFHGVRATLVDRPLGLYGEGALIEFLVAQGLITYGWESESKSFPGNANPTDHTCLVQVWGEHVDALGGSYDVNHVVKPDWGQYPRPNAKVITPPLPKEPPMLITATFTGPITDTAKAVRDDDQGNLFCLNGLKLVKTDGTPMPLQKLGGLDVLPHDQAHWPLPDWAYGGMEPVYENNARIGVRQCFQHLADGTVHYREFHFA